MSFKGKSSAYSHLGLGKALLGKFYRRSGPGRFEAIEYPFAVTLSDPNAGDALGVSLFGLLI